MCACVCQKFPLLQVHKSKFEEDTVEGTTITLLTCFFKLFSKWTWPNPIFLTQPYSLPTSGNWNPIASLQDSQHLMPVLTPVDPQTLYQSNTCSHVSSLSLQNLKSEFARGYKLINKINKGKL
jgi:poly(A) polymerase